ncbi:sugar phosphate isomerase/epimerase family protein [Zhongshania sp.]|uniref:sugar phosphate isomerase/epimerase family protein n=1 Tax=Zhongshania sp. TaxID=1971902 RepID=UPI00356446BD
MHERIAVTGICFLSNSLKEQAGYWRHLDAKRVSLVGPVLDAEGVAAAQAALATGNYQLETIMHPFLPGQALSANSADWVQPRQRLSAQIKVAATLGAKSIYMLTGGHGNMLWEQAAEVFIKAVAPCVGQARDAGIALMIENAPPQYADIHIAHTLRDTISLAEMADIGVCIDLFSCWTEPDLKALIERAVPRCDLVQVSDYVLGDRALPARAVIGDGAMPIPLMLNYLLAAGYQGAFDMELLGPRIDEEGALAATARAGAVLGNMLQGLGA